MHDRQSHPRSGEQQSLVAFQSILVADTGLTTQPSRCAGEGIISRRAAGAPALEPLVHRFDVA
jgi:hypothetical protein